MQIPNWPIAGERELDLVRQVLESPQWGGFHEIVGEFERQFAAFQHCRHCVTASNGTVTLEIGLAASGIGPGDEVIVPAVSFISTATAVNRVGATPVFVDVEEYSFNMDPLRAAAAITDKTKALIAVHFGGPLANMDSLQNLAEQAGVMLIEDAAHAHGSDWRGRRAGSFGRWASFSFQNGKVLTAGEGGALTTNDDELAELFRSYANQGRRADGESFFHHYRLASNQRMTALQAAVLIGQLERLPAQIALRSEREALLRSLALGIQWQSVPEQVNQHSHYLVLGRTPHRDALGERLKAAGVPFTPFYPHGLYGNPIYRDGVASHRATPCPVTEDCLRDAFWLPHRVLHAEEETIREIAALMA
ncbi:MAG: DegT/DnrJ/EryC1/StrS family aminotransferase [Verrucomicrobiota bacterium]